MVRCQAVALSMVMILGTGPAAAGDSFSGFLDEIGTALGIDGGDCPAAFTPPSVESGHFSTCAAVGGGFNRFRKSWRKLLAASASIRPDSSPGWEKMSTGIRSSRFLYRGFPGNVYFDEQQGRVFFTIRASLAPCPGADPMLPRAGEAVFHVGSSNVTPPRRTHSVNPRFPPSLRNVPRGGTVLLRSIIDRDGSPTRACVLKATPDQEDMKSSALEAVRQWRYEPAKREGEAVLYYLTIQVRFAVR